MPVTIMVSECWKPSSSPRSQPNVSASHARPISDGTLYPAIKRLVRDGLLEQASGPGKAGAARVTLHLTDTGRADLEARLRSASGQDVTNVHRFTIVLAFLSRLPDKAERDAVLQRRLDFLSEPASFFYEDDRPLRAADLTDPYRRGILVAARAANRAERVWLREMLSPAGDNGEEAMR